MPPKITDTVAWQQAELLMQPAFIRLIDNIRVSLEKSAWRGTYQDVLIWPDGTPEETKAIVIDLLQQLETASPEGLAEIERDLRDLPTPQPGYQLCLQHPGLPPVNIDVWELCYQVCFRNYESNNSKVDIDISLIDETGDVDWHNLDVKAGRVVHQVFADLPGG